MRTSIESSKGGESYSLYKTVGFSFSAYNDKHSKLFYKRKIRTNAKKSRWSYRLHDALTLVFNKNPKLIFLLDRTKQDFDYFLSLNFFNTNKIEKSMNNVCQL